MGFAFRLQIFVCTMRVPPCCGIIANLVGSGGTAGCHVYASSTRGVFHFMYLTFLFFPDVYMI